jgi:hypothetical protein
MPDAGAAGTSGASLGFCRGGKGICVPCVLAVALVVRLLIIGGVECETPVLTMAEVERIADGRLAMGSSPSRDDSLWPPLDKAGGGGIVFFEEEDVGRWPPDVAGRGGA